MKKIGPCKVVRKVNDNAYVIDLLDHLSISSHFQCGRFVRVHIPIPDVPLYPNGNSRTSFFQGENNEERVEQ